MENSSASPTSLESPIVFPPNAFPVGTTILVAFGGLILFIAPVIIAVFVWFAIHGLDVPGINRAFIGLFGIGVQSAAEIVVIAFLLAVLPSLSKTSLDGLGFHAPRKTDWGKVGLAIAAMFIVVNLLGSLVMSALHFKTPELAIAVFTHMVGWQKILFGFFAVIVGPVWEEFVFRIFLFNAMRKWWGFWPGAIVSSVLFGLAHAQQPLVPAMFLSLSGPLALGGIVLCVIYARTGSAYANMITHAGFNLLSLALISVAPQLAK